MRNTNIKRWRCCLALVFVIATATLAPVAWSAPSRQDRAEASKLVNAGVRQDKKGEHEQARKSFEEAIELHDTPQTRLLLAQSLINLGLFLEAREHAEAVTNNNKVRYHDRQKAKNLLRTIEQGLAHLTIKGSDEVTARVKVNGVTIDSSSFDVPIEYNPGTIKVTAQAEGYMPFEKTVGLTEGESITVKIFMVEEESVGQAGGSDKESNVGGDSSSGGGSAIRTIGWVSIGVGAVGLGLGTGFGFAARSTRQDLRDQCVKDICTEKERDTFNKGKTQATVSTTGFVVGGIGLTAGIIMLIAAPSMSKEQEGSTSKTGIRPYIGAQSAGFFGTF